MSGISKLADAAKKFNSEIGKELILKDIGDIAIVSLPMTGDGDANDKYTHLMDDFYQHSEDLGAGKWGNFKFCSQSLDKLCTCDTKKKPSHRIGFWAYVDYVLHINQKIETWTPIQNAQKTQKYFKEEVNDFRLFSMAYGKEGSNMNQLVEIHSVHESLNKKIIRIKKSSNKGDYILTATDNAVEFSDEDVKNLKSLISVKQYFQEKYAEKQENASVPLDDVETEKVSSPVVTKGRTVRKTPPVKQIEEGTSDEEVDVDSAMEDIF